MMKPNPKQLSPHTKSNNLVLVEFKNFTLPTKSHGLNFQLFVGVHWFVQVFKVETLLVIFF